MILPMVLALGAAALPTAPHSQATLVLKNGVVFAGKDLPRGTAIAISGEVVLDVGSDSEIAPLVGPATRVVDLKGRLVVPGFDDAHVHFLSGGFGLLSVDLRDASSEEEMARRVGAYARKLPKGAWVLEGNWDHERWAVKRLPTRKALDPLTPENPVFVNRLDGHMALANSLALKLAGIGRETKDPPGGTIVRDADGEPTGVLKDNAMDLVAKAIPEPSHEQNLAAARAALKEAARLGVTSVQDGSGTDAVRTYLDLEQRGELTARVGVWRHAGDVAALAKAGIPAGIGDDFVRLEAVKLFADGSMGAGTAAFFEPYADDPKTSGLLVTPPDELRRLVFDADAAGWPVFVHAIGDRANANVLDVFESLVGELGPRPMRLRIEHAQVVREKDLDRFARLGVVASIQPCHALDDLRWARKRIGGARLADAYRLRSFLAKGIPVAFGTDWPVEPLDPRLGLYAAVTTKAPAGVAPEDWRSGEKVPLAEAIDLYTRGAAAAERCDGRKGTLEKGKLADLAVFHEDLFALEREPEQLLAVPVDLTVVGGRVVYERPAGTP